MCINHRVYGINAASIASTWIEQLITRWQHWHNNGGQANFKLVVGKMSDYCYILLTIQFIT